MKKYVLVIFVISVTFLLTQTVYSKTTKDAYSQVKHSSNLFDSAFFDQAFERGQRYKKKASGNVYGGIVPHHLLAAPLMAGFFEGIATQKVVTVILISPNHHGVGPYTIATSKGTWTTIFGDLETDTEKVSQLEKTKTAFVSEAIFDTEHGIYGLTPFIKKTFPHAKLVPIAINSGTSKEECDALVKSLNTIADDHTIILVSADFSHYLPSAQADIYDKESLAAIRRFEVDKVFHLDREKHVDSPESVYTLLKLMQLRKATNITLLENTNSAKLMNKLDIKSTTSYFTLYFTKDIKTLKRTENEL